MPPKKRCPKGQVRNPSTNRCIKKDGATASKLKTSSSSSGRKDSEAKKTTHKTDVKPKAKKTTSSSETPIFKEGLQVAAAALPLLKRVPKACLRLTTDKSETMVKWSNNAYKVTRYEDASISAHDSKTGLDAQGVIDVIRAYPATQVCLTADKLNPSHAPNIFLVIWKKN